MNDPRHRCRRLARRAAALVLIAAGCAEPDTTQPVAPASTIGQIPTTIGPLPVFGRARVEPAIVDRGASITITPAATIDPQCGNPAEVFVLVEGEPVHAGVLDANGDWTAADAVVPHYYLACLPMPSSEAHTYVLPEALPPGDYVVCMTSGISDDGCGAIRVEGAPDPPRDPTVAQVRQHRWVGVLAADDPSAAAPSLRFGSGPAPGGDTREAFVGTAGCNLWYAGIAENAGSLTVTDVSAFTDPCGGMPAGWAPRDGDSIALTADGRSLQIPGGDDTRTYVAFDSLPVATTEQIVGTWRIGDLETVVLTDTTFTVGDCTAPWQVADIDTGGRVESPQRDACIRPFPEFAVHTVIAELFDAPTEIRITDDGRTLLVAAYAADVAVIRLTRGD